MPIRCCENIKMAIDIVRRLEVPELYSVRGLSVRSKAARRLVSQVVSQHGAQQSRRLVSTRHRHGGMIYMLRPIDDR